jgi:hypothetical protein
MSSSECLSCLNKKASLQCDLCKNPCCKDCIIFIDEDLFELTALLPPKIQDKGLCANCYNIEAMPIIDEYQEILARAKQVNVYDIQQSQETYKMPKHEKPLVVHECDDREETLLRLAFLAAQKGFNTLADVDIQSKKSKQGGSYKKLVWSGRGIPLNR